MLNNPCVQIFAKVDPEEFKELCSFVKKRLSPHTQEYELFKYLRSCYPHFTEENTDPKHLYTLLFKDKSGENVANSLSTVANRLHKVFQDYLIEHALKSNPQEKEFLLACEYSRLGLQEALDKRIEQQVQIGAWSEQPTSSTSSTINVWYPWNLHRLFYLKYYSRDTIKSAAREMNLKYSLEQLHVAYLQAKLRIALEIASLQYLNGQPQPYLEFSIQELTEIRDKAEGKNAFLFLYSQAYDLATVPSVEKYRDFKKLLFQMGNTLSKDEHGNLLAVLINFVSRAIQKGDLSYYQEALELHHYGLNTRVLLQDDKITPEILMSLINISYEIGHLENTAKSCQEWYKFLPQSVKQESIAVLNGRIHFHQGHFQDAVKEISKVKRFQIHLLELSARTTIIQSHYELNNFDSLISACDTFSKALTRTENRFSVQQRKSFGNFIKIMQSICQDKLNPNTNWSVKKEKLLRKIEKLEPLSCKKWILNKIQNLS